MTLRGCLLFKPAILLYCACYITAYTLETFEDVNRASVPCSGPGMGWDVSKLPNRAGVGNICAQYPFSAGSPNETFQSKTLAACFVSQRPVGFSATGTCWQTRWFIYYYSRHVATKDQCAEKYSRYSHLLLLNHVYPRR